MSAILSKKFTKLRKELQYHQSELEYVQEVLKEWHLKFEDYHREYCKRNSIDLNKLNQEFEKEIQRIIPKPLTKNTGVVLYKNSEDVFKKIYKKIARKLHPDIGGDEEEFKKATSAVQEKNFEKLLDICDRNVILIEIDEEVINLLKEQISNTKEKIKQEKSTYSWNLFLCEENTKCMDNTIKKFLKHLFKYEEKK